MGQENTKNKIIDIATIKDSRQNIYYRQENESWKWNIRMKYENHFVVVHVPFRSSLITHGFRVLGWKPKKINSIPQDEFQLSHRHRHCNILQHVSSMPIFTECIFIRCVFGGSRTRKVERTLEKFIRGDYNK